MCSVGLFVTLVPRTMVCMSSVDGLLHLGVVHCFWCILLTFRHASVSRTVWYESSCQFVACLAYCFVCFLLTVCYVSVFWLFGTLVPRALVWTCSVRLFVRLVFCTFFSMYSVGLFVTLVPRTLLYVFCLILCHVYALHNVLYVVCLIFCHGSVLGTVFNVFWCLFAS